MQSRKAAERQRERDREREREGEGMEVGDNEKKEEEEEEGKERRERVKMLCSLEERWSGQPITRARGPCHDNRTANGGLRWLSPIAVVTLMNGLDHDHLCGYHG